MAHEAVEATRCSGCGSFPDDHVDEEGRRLQPDSHHVEIVGCWGCRHMAANQKNLEKLQEKDKGLSQRMVRGPRPEWVEAQQAKPVDVDPLLWRVVPNSFIAASAQPDVDHLWDGLLLE